jgi:hypothetical protein
MTVVGYEAPPLPAAAEGDNVIRIPEEEGTPATILTTEGGLRIFLHREAHDMAAADHYAKAASDFLNTPTEEAGEYLGFPTAQRPDLWTWISRRTLERCLHFHDETVASPIAKQKMAGRQIVVPMGDGMAKITGHGPGKRR